MRAKKKIIRVCGKINKRIIYVYRLLQGLELAISGFFSNCQLSLCPKLKKKKIFFVNPFFFS